MTGISVAAKEPLQEACSIGAALSPHNSDRPLPKLPAAARPAKATSGHDLQRSVSGWPPPKNSR
jgi:hypothetical protein